MAVPRRFLKYWLPVLLWMGVVFSASTDGMSQGRTSRFIAPVLRWIQPDMSEETVMMLVGMIRKTAHVVEYAILSMLVWIALRQPQRSDPRPWNWRLACTAMAIAAIYAMTDEFHQSFVPTRGASWRDVGLDTAGAAIGILMIWLFTQWRRSR